MGVHSKPEPLCTCVSKKCLKCGEVESWQGEAA